MSIEFINEWAKKNCPAEEQIKAEEIAAEWEVEHVMPSLKDLVITTTPLKILSKDFKTRKGFVKAMFTAADYFKNANDIVVRYAKPEDENGNIVPCFEILKSKSKVFLKYLIDNNKALTFVIETSKDIKSSIKFFSSIGVKGEDRTPLKEIESDLKDKIVDDKILLAEIKANRNEEDIYSELTYNQVSNGYNAKKYNEIKQEIEEIIFYDNANNDNDGIYNHANE